MCQCTERSTLMKTRGSTHLQLRATAAEVKPGEARREAGRLGHAHKLLIKVAANNAERAQAAEVRQLLQGFG